MTFMEISLTELVPKDGRIADLGCGSGHFDFSGDEF